MDTKMREAGADAVLAHDSEKLLANGRFLADRFAVPSLRLDGPGAAVDPVGVREAEAARAVRPGPRFPTRPARRRASASASGEPARRTVRRAPGVRSTSRSPGSGGGSGRSRPRRSPVARAAWRRCDLSRAAASGHEPDAAGTAPAPVNAPPATPGLPSEGPVAAAATPLLDELGRDLTALARDGLLAPAIGRDAETDRLVEALCRPTRPSAVLLG